MNGRLSKVEAVALIVAVLLVVYWATRTAARRFVSPKWASLFALLAPLIIGGLIGGPAVGVLIALPAGVWFMIDMIRLPKKPS